jgi:uncharacterized membrane protein
MNEILNSEIIQIILHALAYGFLAGFTFFLLPWGVKLVVSIIRPN